MPSLVPIEFMYTSNLAAIEKIRTVGEYRRYRLKLNW